MRTEIAVETLKSGETLTIERVLPPDETRNAQIRPFLGHKPPNYLAHIHAALAGACDGLESYFYLGLLNGEVVGNIMTVESGGVGILGHVHTREDQRRKGICTAIMRHQMADFRQRGGHALLLGTGYQSAAYHIYASFGFRDWEIGHPGLMRYDNPDDPDFAAHYFAPAPSRPAPAQWKHWPLVSLLAAVPSEVYLRSLTLPLWGVNLLEGPYCQFMAVHRARETTRAAALESETGAARAMATCVPDSRWAGSVRLLDVFAHPNVTGAELAGLLEALPLPDEKTHAYADPRDTAKIAALEQTGFRRQTVLPEQFREGETWRDAWLYVRP
jgi:GNAT superfamily N-acetyltransferase